MPLLRQLLSTKSIIRYRPPNGTAGLERHMVRFFSREPRPPARIRAKVFLVRRLTKRGFFFATIIEVPRLLRMRKNSVPTGFSLGAYANI